MKNKHLRGEHDFDLGVSEATTAWPFLSNAIQSGAGSIAEIKQHRCRRHHPEKEVSEFSSSWRTNADCYLKVF
jgi:hypothetical protein